MRSKISILFTNKVSDNVVFFLPLSSPSPSPSLSFSLPLSVHTQKSHSDVT